MNNCYKQISKEWKYSKTGDQKKTEEMEKRYEEKDNMLSFYAALTTIYLSYPSLIERKKNMKKIFV